MTALTLRLAVREASDRPLSSRSMPQATVPATAEFDAIVDAARAGDRGALGRLYERFVRVVHGIVLGQVGPQDAEDLTQEVFMVVQRKLATVRESAAVPGWICAIARHHAVDHLRRRKRAPTLAPLPEVPARERGEDELAERALARIRELPEAYREPLILRLVEGLTGPEIAERTGLTQGSVRVNLCRGMAMLRPLLERDGWSP
jgi:RNA polymerase sigma-70 factor (ECF subfamily)